MKQASEWCVGSGPKNRTSFCLKSKKKNKTTLF